MKRFTWFELTVISFLCSLVISTYVMSLLVTDHLVGPTLRWISLVPVLDRINFPVSYQLFLSFLFLVLIYTVYGLLISFIIRVTDKARLVVVPLLLAALVFGVVEQRKVLPITKIAETSPAAVGTLGADDHQAIKTNQQYFGLEATGDLNDDKDADIAFLIVRPDEVKGPLYYLAASLATTTGHIGTNLIFLGERVADPKIVIEQGTIAIDYLDRAAETPDTRGIVYARVIKNVLQKVEKPIETSTTTPDR